MLQELPDFLLVRLLCNQLIINVKSTWSGLHHKTPPLVQLLRMTYLCLIVYHAAVDMCTSSGSIYARTCILWLSSSSCSFPSMWVIKCMCNVCLQKTARWQANPTWCSLLSGSNCHARAVGGTFTRPAMLRWKQRDRCRQGWFSCCSAVSRQTTIGKIGVWICWNNTEVLFWRR